MAEAVEGIAGSGAHQCEATSNIPSSISKPKQQQREEDITARTNEESGCNVSEQDSEYDTEQFLMENFSFSLTSTHSSSITPDKYFCRICHQRNLMEANISPCECRGTMGQVHKSCLEQWLAASDTAKCEICGFQFTVQRELKYNFLKALMVWLTTVESRRERLYMISDCIGFLTAFPMVLLANHQTITLLDMFQLDEVDIADIFLPFLQPNLVFNEIALSAGRLLTFFIVGTVSFLDVFYFGWLFMRFQRHFSEWYKWYRTQCIVHLILP